MAYNKYGFDAGKNKTPMGDTSAIESRLSDIEARMRRMFPTAWNGNQNTCCPIAIGEVYISMKTTSPDKIWPNTRWTAVSSGRVLMNWSPTSNASNMVNSDAYQKYHDKFPSVQQYNLSVPGTTVGSWNTTTNLAVDSLPPHGHPLSYGVIHHTHDLIIDEHTFYNPAEQTEGGTPPVGMTTNHRVYSETTIPSTAWDCRDDDKKVIYYTLRVDMTNWKSGGPTYGAGIDSDGKIRPTTFDKTVPGEMRNPVTTSTMNILQSNGSYKRIDEEGNGWTKQDTQEMADNMYAGTSADFKTGNIISNNVQPSFVVCMWYRIA